jgi:hypothetical protein
MVDIFIRRASVIAALFLLTSAATGSAECVWVLWSVVSEAEVTPGSQPWRLWDAKGFYKTQDECGIAARSWSSGPMKGTKNLSTAVICYPDTVDPRGPKGK